MRMARRRRSAMRGRRADRSPSAASSSSISSSSAARECRMRPLVCAMRRPTAAMKSVMARGPVPAARAPLMSSMAARCRSRPVISRSRPTHMRSEIMSSGSVFSCVLTSRRMIRKPPSISARRGSVSGASSPSRARAGTSGWAESQSRAAPLVRSRCTHSTRPSPRPARSCSTRRGTAPPRPSSRPAKMKPGCKVMPVSPAQCRDAFLRAAPDAIMGHSAATNTR